MTLVRQEFKEYISINVDEPHPLWTEGTSVDAYEYVVHKNFTWKSVVDGNTEEPIKKSAYWVKWGPSNKYAAIDAQSRTYTKKTGGDIVMVLKWTAYDSLVLSGVVASAVNIKISDHTDPTFQNPLWETDIASHARTCVTGWYQYFNVGRQCPVNHAGADEIDAYIKIPPNMIGTVQITFTQSSVHQVTKVGVVLAGMGYYVGCTLAGVGLGLQDFSLYTTDEWGSTNIVRRKAKKKRQLTTLVKQIDVLRIESYVERNILGRTFLMIGDETDNSKYAHLLLLAFLDDFHASIKVGESQKIEFELKENI